MDEYKINGHRRHFLSPLLINIFWIYIFLIIALLLVSFFLRRNLFEPLPYFLHQFVMLTPVVAFFYRVYGYVGQESLIKETSVKLDFTALHINNDEIIIFYSDINKLEFEYLNRNNRTFTPGCHLLRIRYKGKKTFSLVIYDNYSIYDAETYTGQFEEYAENLTRLRSLARTLKVIYNSKQRLYKLHQVKRELKAKN